MKITVMRLFPFFRFPLHIVTDIYINNHYLTEYSTGYHMVYIEYLHLIYKKFKNNDIIIHMRKLMKN